MRPLENTTLGSVAAFLLLGSACGATTAAKSDPEANSASNTVGGGASGGSGGSTAVGPPESGEVQSPMLPIEGDESIVILGSTLGRNPDGQIRWTFTFRNDANAPLCAVLLSPSLLDSAGTMLAGASVFSDEFAAGAPAFSGVVMGSVYRGRRADGVVFLDACVPPGGRGLAFADVFTLAGIQPEEIDVILASAAILRHDLTPGGSSLEDLKLAPDLPLLDELRLVDSPEGKVVQGVALSSADLGSWRVWFALYDANGMIVDVVRAPANAIETLKDTPVQFSSTPTPSTPTRLEPFFESSSLRY